MLKIIDTDKYTEEEILHLNAKEFIGIILFLLLIELFTIIISLSVLDSIIHQVISFITLNFILIIFIFFIIIHKPNLLFLQSNKRWAEKREKYLTSQIDRYKKEVFLINLDPNKDFNNKLKQLNQTIVTKDDELKKLQSIFSESYEQIDNLNIEIENLKNELNAKQIELEESLKEQDKLNKKLKESPNENMKIFIKSLLCIFCDYNVAHNPRTSLSYSKNAIHGGRGILQMKFDNYEYEDDKVKIKGLISPIKGDMLKKWLDDVDIIPGLITQK